jgi:hypothetical protein
MTVPNTNTKVVYLGNGAATVFDIPFAFFAPEHIVAVRVDGESKEHVLTQDCYVDMSARRVLYPGYPPGQAPPASEQPPPLPEGEKLVIYRATPRTQETDLPHQTVLSEIERMDDKAMMCVQEQGEEIGRCVVFPVSESFDGRLGAPVVPGASFRIREDGSGIEYGGDPNLALSNSEAAVATANQAKGIAEAIDGKAAGAVETANAASQAAEEAAGIASEAKGIAEDIGVGGEGAIGTRVVGRTTTVGLKIHPDDRVLSQGSLGLLASLGLSFEGEEIALRGRGGAEIGKIDVGWLIDLARQAIADSSNVLALLSTDGAWTLDFMGGLMPRADAAATAAWALDGDGALLPAASPGETFFWAINETGGLAPKTGGIN